MIQFLHNLASYLWTITGPHFLALIALFLAAFWAWFAWECYRAPIIEDEQNHNLATGRKRAELEK